MCSSAHERVEQLRAAMAQGDFSRGPKEHAPAIFGADSFIGLTIRVTPCSTNGKVPGTQQRQFFVGLFLEFFSSRSVNRVFPPQDFLLSAILSLHGGGAGLVPHAFGNGAANLWIDAQPAANLAVNDGALPLSNFSSSSLAAAPVSPLGLRVEVNRQAVEPVLPVTNWSAFEQCHKRILSDFCDRRSSGVRK
jgi:hypothetical protein